MTASAGGLPYCAALILEIGGLFAAWTWAQTRKPRVGLVLGYAVVIVAMASAVLLAPGIPHLAYAAFPGIYLACTLAWAWWSGGVSPDRWSGARFAVAVIAVATLLIARSSW